MWVEISKVLPVPGQDRDRDWDRDRTDTGTETGTGPRPGPKFFLTRTSTKILSEQGRDQNFSHRDRDEIFFLTGTKNGWSRSCLGVGMG